MGDACRSLPSCHPTIVVCAGCGCTDRAEGEAANDDQTGDNIHDGSQLAARLQPTHQPQHNDNHNQNPNNATRARSPRLRVRPSRQNANQG
jgi:hypothetical protein